MQVNHEIYLKLKVSFDVDELEHVKSGQEMAQSIAEMICDEAVQQDVLVVYDILHTRTELTNLVTKTDYNHDKNLFYDMFMKNADEKI